MKTPLLVFAMHEEHQSLFDDYSTLTTGIGKINATYALTKYLTQHKPPALVINLGTAGSRKHNTDTLLNPTRFIQRDMDVTALGFEKFKTPFSNDPIIIEYGQCLPDLKQGTCGSGDNFDTTTHAERFDVVDMEAYAIALICQRENIPFLCLKYISDGANGNAQDDWNAALHKTATQLRATLKENNL